ncbi:uncharacterized protein LOC135847067 isoform X2 [Planococcus citri]
MELFAQCYQENRKCHQEKDQCHQEKNQCHQEKTQCHQEKNQCQKDKEFLMTSYTLFNTTNDILNKKRSRLEHDILILVAPMVCRKKIEGLKWIILMEIEIAKGRLASLEKKQQKQEPKGTSEITPTEYTLTPEMEETARKLQNAVETLGNQQYRHFSVEYQMNIVLTTYRVKEDKQDWFKDRMRGSVAEWFIGFSISNSESIQKLRQRSTCDILVLSIHLAYLCEIGSDDAYDFGSTLAQLYQFSDSQIVSVMMKKTLFRDECLKEVLSMFFPDA